MAIILLVHSNSLFFFSYASESILWFVSGIIKKITCTFLPPKQVRMASYSSLTFLKNSKKSKDINVDFFSYGTTNSFGPLLLPLI